MESAPAAIGTRRWAGPLTPLSIAVYVTFAAVLMGPLLAWQRGQLTLAPATMAGLIGMLAVPVLWFVRDRCAGRGKAGLPLMRALVLLQLPATLVACWGLGGGSMPILLIVVAGQLGAFYPLRTVALVMLPVDALLLLILQQDWGWSDAVASLLSYAAFQTFAALMTAYAAQAEDAHEAAVRINGELLATRQLLLESARGEERLRLSRELHDVAGHKLTALRLQLRLLARDAATPAVAECERLADELLTDVRGVVGTLREHEGIDLQSALAALVPALPQPRVVLDLAREARVPGLAQAQALLRCAQEGLTNALRHSGAATVTIRLRDEDDGVALSVEDDGHARELPQPGHGLAGMRERLEALGGRLEFALRDGGGLTLRAWLPQAPAA